LDDDEFQREAARVITTFRPLVEPLAAALGTSAEVVLHDLSKLPDSIVAIAGTISGRRQGSPATDLGVQVLSGEAPDHLIGYRTDLPGGIVCRSSSIMLRGTHTRPVAALCINVDITGLMQAKEALEALTNVFPIAVGGITGVASTEEFFGSVEELSAELLRRAIEAVGGTAQELSKAQKVKVVEDLKGRGFFLIKESVEIVAQALGVTRYTIYNYLGEIGEISTSP
jgi:predicted transcriptional regulator YheO